MNYAKNIMNVNDIPENMFIIPIKSGVEVKNKEDKTIGFIAENRILFCGKKEDFKNFKMLLSL